MDVPVLQLLEHGLAGLCILILATIIFAMRKTLDNKDKEISKLNKINHDDQEDRRREILEFSKDYDRTVNEVNRTLDMLARRPL